MALNIMKRLCGIRNISRAFSPRVFLILNPDLAVWAGIFRALGPASMLGNSVTGSRTIQISTGLDKITQMAKFRLNSAETTELCGTLQMEETMVCLDAEIR